VSESKQVWAAIRRLSVQERLDMMIRLQGYFDGIPMTDGPGEDRLPVAASEAIDNEK